MCVNFLTDSTHEKSMISIWVNDVLKPVPHTQVYGFFKFTKLLTNIPRRTTHVELLCTMPCDEPIRLQVTYSHASELLSICKDLRSDSHFGAALQCEIDETTHCVRVSKWWSIETFCANPTEFVTCVVGRNPDWIKIEPTTRKLFEEILKKSDSRLTLVV